MDPLADVEQIRIEVDASAERVFADLAADVERGLSAPFKELKPKYFYDARGCELFDRITELPEYYLTRAERRILEDRAPAIVAASDPTALVELGSGTAAKTRVLLDAMRDAGCLETYVPVDISEEVTRSTAASLVNEYPGLRVHGLVCDFEDGLHELPAGERRLIAFLGSTIGNLGPAARRHFLSRLAARMGPGDSLLLGTDLVKDRARLEAAYDDPGGVTAEFNKNVLAVLNRELGADFDLTAFEHVARWDAAAERMDIRLRSLADQTVRLDALGMEVAFARDEEMRTEFSCKFTRRRVERILASVGLDLAAWWTDPDDLFALSLARAR
jgi:L-histidine N-alpha-methyltransferase